MELNIKAYSYQLKFIHPFGIAHGIRSTTDSFFVSAAFSGKTGYGEAALPPYLGYDVEELVSKFSIFFPGTLTGIAAITELSARLKTDSSIPVPVKAATDIALMDLYGQLTGKPMRNLLGIPSGDKTLCTYTLGISSIDDLLTKLDEAKEFRFFKHKMGGVNDRERIEAYLSYSEMPFCVDANQAYKSVDEALEAISWLKEKGCLFIEQPLPVSMSEEQKILFSKTTLPIILDESIQNIRELESNHLYCHGINVKLAKCGGINPAVELIRRARKLNKKILIGCMSESSCGAAAASQLSGWADWADLDGPMLISNDPFTGIRYREGILVPNNTSGSGAYPIADLAK